MVWTHGRRELAISGRLPLEQGAAFEQAIWRGETVLANLILLPRVARHRLRAMHPEAWRGHTGTQLSYSPWNNGHAIGWIHPGGASGILGPRSPNADIAANGRLTLR